MFFLILVKHNMFQRDITLARKTEITAVFNTSSKSCVLPPQLKSTEEQILRATFNQNKQ